MSRTTPDPVFAAAARAELERRVRSADARTARTRRPWVMELTAMAGVLVLVGGIALGLTTLRPVFDRSVQAGSVTQSPTSEPSQTPLASPTTEAPTTAPTTEAPVTSPPTTAPPVATTPPTAPATTPPSSAGSTGLVGPTGAQQRSAAEIRSWALSIGNSEIWAEQAVLDAACMADHGFLYDPEFAYRSGLAAEHAGLTDAQYQAFQVAYYGPETDAPYDWTTAGCHGRSVHLTGQDDAN